jgi:subtilisin family serine protease
MASVMAALIMLVSSVASPIPVAGAPSTVRLVVSFRPGTSAARADQLAAAGGNVVVRIDQINVRVVDMPAVAADHARARWAASGEVRAVEADGPVTIDWMPPDPYWAEQREFRQIRTPRAWDLERGRYSTVVAVIDTGVQFGHPDLTDRLIGGHDFVNDDNYPADDHGHGTAVSGIVAATSNGLGMAGMCSRCKVMPVKALDENGNGLWSVAAVAIVWAADHGADVINLSFGGPTGGTALQDAISYARSKGAVVVGAAGNFSSTTKFYPAALTGVISVAAADNLDLRYDFSNHSTQWVDLAAPGCTLATHVGSSYSGFCGTSAATPFVSGLAALIESTSTGMTRWEVERILLGSTVNMPWPFTRLGRIDAFEAVYRALHDAAPSASTLQPSPPLLSPRAEVTFKSGKHEGYRFDANGAILNGTGIMLDAASTGLTSRRMTIPGRDGRWFYMVDGTLDGWWVAESSRVFFTPEPTPTPTPTPTATPSPTP